MFFDQTVEYALRVMACLALQSEGGKVRSQELAEQTGVPRAYLSKVLRRMVTAGLLDAEKGHKGGFCLAKPAEKVRLYDVIEVLVVDKLPRRCVFGLDVCSDTTPCVLHNRWRQLRLLFEDWAKKTTLADIRHDVGSMKDSSPHLRRWKALLLEKN